MSDFDQQSLDEGNFGPSNALNAVKAFDAFPKTKSNYTQKTNSGGVWTVVLVLASIWLAATELGRWWKGDTTHTFSVEQGVGHDMQINLDVVVAMKCEDIHVNIQDTSGDRIMAGVALTKSPTTWKQWRTKGRVLGHTKEERLDLSGYPGFGEYREEDVHQYLGATKGSKKFKKTPGLPRGVAADSCRVWGSLHSNKVQGDFHITARGHGYTELGHHLDHGAFNFSHHINELSFGPYYPSLTNPLDNTVATTDSHFYKYQYYLSVVPTVYTTDLKALRKIDKQYESPASGSDGLQAHPHRHSKKTIFTNQYAVTEQSHPVPHNLIPGVFVKYDIEPIMLTIAEDWASLPALLIRLVNIVSGVLVAGGWCYQLTEWAKEVQGRRKRNAGGYDGAMITPMSAKGEKSEYFTPSAAREQPAYSPGFHRAETVGNLYTPAAPRERDPYHPANSGLNGYGIGDAKRSS